MKLKDFIKTILAEVNTGIKESQQETNMRTWLDDNGKAKGIEFDVAVTASSEGDNADAKIVKEGAHRVKFTIVVLDPDK